MSRGRAGSEPPPAPEGPARGPARAWSNAFIVGFLLLQVFVPLHYYATGGGSDERFAWRFFSTIRMRHCEVRVDEAVDRGGAVERRAVDLPSELPTPWIAMLERERPQVVARFLRRRCESADVREVFYRRTCIDTDGRTLRPREVAWDCARGEVRGGSGGA